MRSDDQVLQYSMDIEKEISSFDFDRWSEMAQQDPKKFEAMRQQFISDLLAQTPPHLKQRMIGLQWQVDQIRMQASNPMAACLQISQRMWANVLEEKGLLESKTIQNTPKAEPKGKVLSFEKYKANKQV